MLLPNQVIPFLSHADEFLRDQAIIYFQSAHDPAPLTADDVWNALDQLDPSAATDSLIRLLPLLPGSDAATHRLITAVDADKYLEAEEDIWSALEDLDIAQLQRHTDAILAIPDLPDDVRDNINERLELARLTPEQLWDRLLHYLDANKAKYWDELDRGPALRLVKALAAHGAAAVAERATQLASAPSDDCRDIFAIDVLAELRHRPALDMLVARFIDANEDDDVEHETLMVAIPRVGGADAVYDIEPPFADIGLPAYLNYGIGLLGRIKHPDAEAALIRLFDRTRDPDDRTYVAMALSNLITTDALPRLRDIVLAKEYDSRVIDLDRSLIACSIMSGFEFPELGGLREEVIAQELERERRFEAGDFSALGLGDFPDDLTADDFNDDLDDDSLDDDSLDDSRPTPTIRNQGPKIGRNDPCPCGSGKKYKKCCGK
jgi:hypothetical protein